MPRGSDLTLSDKATLGLFFISHIANVRGYRPMMTKRVFEYAIAIAPECVLEWRLPSKGGSSGRHGNLIASC